MTAPSDLSKVINQADDLLDDINQANLKFVDKANQKITAINQGFKTADKLNRELEREEFEALEKMDGQILDYLAKSEE